MYSSIWKLIQKGSPGFIKIPLVSMTQERLRVVLYFNSVPNPTIFWKVKIMERKTWWSLTDPKFWHWKWWFHLCQYRWNDFTNLLPFNMVPSCSNARSVDDYDNSFPPAYDVLCVNSGLSNLRNVLKLVAISNQLNINLHHWRMHNGGKTVPAKSNEENNVLQIQKSNGLFWVCFLGWNKLHFIIISISLGKSNYENVCWS